jgi:hypothetical protein
MRGGAVAARQAHNLEVAGSNPAPASGPDLWGEPRPAGKPAVSWERGFDSRRVHFGKRPPSRRRPPLNLPLPGGAQEPTMAQFKSFSQLFVHSLFGEVRDDVDYKLFKDWQLKVCAQEKLDLKVAEKVLRYVQECLKSCYNDLVNYVEAERSEMFETLKHKYNELVVSRSWHKKLEDGLRSFRSFRYESTDVLIGVLAKLGLKFEPVVQLAKLFLEEVDVRYLKIVPKVLQDVTVCVLATFSDDPVKVARSLLRRDAIVYFPDSMFLKESG